MTLLWLVAGASLLVAFVALTKARRAAKRLEQLSQMYWELKYQHGELRVELQRRGALPAPGSEPVRPDPAPAGQPSGAFVPLASLKR